MWKNINKKTQVVGLGWIDCADNSACLIPKSNHLLYLFTLESKGVNNNGNGA